MSLFPEVANPYLTALAGGFLFGIAACTSTCLPFVASYIAGINAGFRRGVVVTLTFNSGRVLAYALIGAAIGAFKLLVDTSFLSSFQAYSSAAFSVVTIATGATILVRDKRQTHCDCPSETQTDIKLRRLRGFDLGAFTLGLSRGLVLCAPMLALVGYSVTFASPFDSFALAVLFGLGTALSPLIILLGGATGWLLNKAPLFRKWISRLGATALIILGLITLVDAIII